MKMERASRKEEGHGINGHPESRPAMSITAMSCSKLFYKRIFMIE